MTVSDTCDADPLFSLLLITTNEGDEISSSDPLQDETLGDGHTIDDIEVDGEGYISLRAERSGLGDGSVYTITCEATGQSGNTDSALDTVTVPQKQ